MHTPGTRKGEEMKQHAGREPGREDKEKSHADRPAGHRIPRDATGINPEKMGNTTGGPEMPPA